MATAPDVWNFKTSVTPFFGHWACVVALPSILTQYAMTFGASDKVLVRPLAASLEVIRFGASGHAKLP